MGVELQILKHLARDPHPTVAIVDEYCAEYKELFKEVRNYECFKYLHLGIISTIKRKSLPYESEPTPMQLARYFHLDDRDFDSVLIRRGNQNRLGFALQLVSVRFLGTFLENPIDVRLGVIIYVATQLGISDIECLPRYLERSVTHWEH